MNLFIIYNFLIGLWIYWANGQTNNRKEDQWYKEEWPAQPYAFGYEIRDYSGNEQYRKEMSDGDRVTGSYGYLGPDGLYRHVEYIADINGFRAKIRTTEPGTANDNPSNVQIEANPILVLPNPSPVVPIPVDPGVTPGGQYGGVSTGPGQGFRRDGIRRPPERPQINSNPNRSTYANRSAPPQMPEPSRGSTTPPIDDRRAQNGDQFNVNRGLQPDGPQPFKPNFDDSPPLLRSPIDSTRGRPNGDPNEVPHGDIPDNVVPYRGAIPRRPDDSPREVPRFDDPRQNQGSTQHDPGQNGGDRGNGVRPPYAVRVPSQPIRPSVQPYDRGYDRTGPRNGDQNFNDNRGRPPPRPDDRRYEVTTKGGSPKRPPQDMGFIEATKGPISPFRPPNKFYDNKPNAVFDDDNEYDDQFKRRQDDDKNIVMINKPVFEDRDRDRGRDRDRDRDRDRNRQQDRDRDTPRKIGGFVRSRYNTTRPDSRNGVKAVGPPPPTIRDSFNRTLNDSSYDANQGRRDSSDKRVRRPTKVFVTSGPISGIPDKRVPPIEGDNRSFGGTDVQHRQQHIDIDYDNKNTRDGQQISSDAFKGQTDRDRPLPPIQREEIPPQNVRPYYGARRDGTRDSVPKRPQSETPVSRQPSPPYDSRDEQQYLQTPDEHIPRQRDDEDHQKGRPQVYQPLRPNHRPDRQPLPRRPESRPYRPRTQTQDRSYEEQSIEVQPYQTQNSASITSPVNTIPTAYKPVDSLEDEKPSKDEEKPSFNTPLSPSSYIVTPFPINETKIQIKPIIVSKPEVFTQDPEVYTQVNRMEVPKFGTRLQTPQPPTQQIYAPIDESLEDHQKDYNYSNEGTDDQSYNSNDYQNENQNNDQNLNPIDSLTENPIDDQSPQQYDNVENDQYYAYYDDQTQDVQNKDSSKDVIFTQTAAQKTDENISMNSNNSLPIQITQKVTNVMNWHKYDSSGIPLIQ